MQKQNYIINNRQPILVFFPPSAHSIFRNMFSLLSRSFATYPIVTWTLVGASAYLFKVGAVASYHQRLFADQET